MPEQPADPSRGMALEDRARSFAAEYFAHWSETNAEALGYFADAYAEQVNFYGHAIGRRSLMSQKRDYVGRWPVRVYSARPDLLAVLCNAANRTCVVSGIVDWDCRSPERNARSVGAANFSLTVRLTADEVRIVAESGSVISRQVD